MIIPKLDIIPNLSKKKLEELIKYLSDKYYNEKEVVEDKYYDYVVRILREKDPDNRVLNNIGAPVREDVKKVELEYFLGSLQDIFLSDNKLKKWIGKDVIISDKLDGVSCLIIYKNGKINMFTRGNGEIGQDISYLSSYFKLPQIKDNIAIRGEIVLKKEKFIEDYSDKFPKPLSVVTGLINSKKPNLKILKDLDFIAYELLSENINIEEQLNLLKKYKFNIVWNKLIKIDQNELIKNLCQRKIDSEYPIDGLVAFENIIYKKEKVKFPKYAFAFKINDKPIKTKVTDVVWKTGKYGHITPTIHYEMIIINGDECKKCTGFNAKFIKKNKIGIGSEIEIIKSGTVIPYIVNVIKSTKAKFPSKKFHWSDSKVDIIIDKFDDDVFQSRLVSIFKDLNIKGIGEGNVKKIFNEGYNNLSKIYYASRSDFEKINGFKKKSSYNLYSNIHNILDKSIKLEVLMKISFCFGINVGTKKFKILIDNIPDILNKKKITYDELLLIKGFSKITSKEIIEGYNNFWIWLEQHKFLKILIPNNNILKNQKYKNMNIVITGTRDKKIFQFIEQEGGNIQDNVNKKTNLVLTTSLTSNSNKIKKAKELNIEIKLINQL